MPRISGTTPSPPSGGGTPTLLDQIRQNITIHKETAEVVRAQLRGGLTHLGSKAPVSQRLKLLEFARQTLLSAKSAKSSGHQKLLSEITGQQQALTAPKAILTKPSKLDAPDQRRLALLKDAKDPHTLGKLFSSRAHEDATSISVLGKVHPKHIPGAQRGALAAKTSKAFFSALKRKLLGQLGARRKATQALISDPKTMMSRWNARTPKQRAEVLRSFGLAAADAKRLAQHGALPPERLKGLLNVAAKQLAVAEKEVGQLMPERFPRDCSYLNKFKPVVQQLRKQLGIKAGSFADNAITQRLKDGQEASDKNALFATLASITCSLVTMAVGGGFLVGVLNGAMSSAVTSAPGTLGASHGVDGLTAASRHGLASKAAAKAAQDNAASAKRGMVKGVVLGAVGGAAGEAGSRIIKQTAKAIGKGALRQAGKKALERAAKGAERLAANKATRNRLGDAMSLAIGVGVTVPHGEVPK